MVAVELSILEFLVRRNTCNPSWYARSVCQLHPPFMGFFFACLGQCLALDTRRLRKYEIPEEWIDTDGRLYPATQEMVLGSSIGALTGGVDP